jgi:hypothetical protein
MQWNHEIRICEDPTDAFAVRLGNLDLSVPIKIASRKIRDQLGFTEVVSIADGLRHTIADELARDERS